MNKEEIEAAKQVLELVSFLPENFTEYGGYIVIAGYLEQALQENERLQAVIWICDQVLTDGFDNGEGTEELPGYDIQAVNWVHKQLSQALKEQEEGE